MPSHRGFSVAASIPPGRVRPGRGRSSRASVETLPNGGRTVTGLSGFPAMPRDSCLTIKGFYAPIRRLPDPWRRML